MFVIDGFPRRCFYGGLSDRIISKRERERRRRSKEEDFVQNFKTHLTDSVFGLTVEFSNFVSGNTLHFHDERRERAQVSVHKSSTTDRD